MSLHTIEEIIEDFRQGRMIVLIDDDDSVAEGDLMMAADCVDADAVNFMAHHGRGLIGVTLTREKARELQLPLMVSDADHSQSVDFTVSIEAARGVSTGISAADRAHTIRTAVDPEARASDLVQPGHVFPQLAQPGGVLTRAGYAEAGCDLARLAGRAPAAALVDVLNEDGSLASRGELERMARDLGLKIGTIADLIRFRIQNEKTIERAADTTLMTEFGEFRVIAYRDVIENDLHFALVRGEPDGEAPVLVRVHVVNPLCDLTASTMADCGWPVRDVLRRFAEEAGVLVILCNQVSTDELVAQLQRYAEGVVGVEEVRGPTHTGDLRVIGIGAQILVDLGVRKMRVLSLPKKFHAISGFGLEVVEYVN